MTTATIPATEKQMSFLRSLNDEIVTLDPDMAADAPINWDGIAALGKRTVSDLISSAIAQRDELRTQDRIARAAEGRPAASALPPEGIHYAEGIVFKVQLSRTGNAYAKQLDASTGEFEYVGRRPFGKLSDDTLMTREDAAEFGKLYGMCANCAATLTDEKSIERGYGPVCAKRFVGFVIPP